MGCYGGTQDALIAEKCYLKDDTIISLVRKIKNRFDAGLVDVVEKSPGRNSIETELNAIRRGYAKDSVEYFEAEIVKRSQKSLPHTEIPSREWLEVLTLVKDHEVGSATNAHGSISNSNVLQESSLSDDKGDQSIGQYTNDINMDPLTHENTNMDPQDLGSMHENSKVVITPVAAIDDSKELYVKMYTPDTNRSVSRIGGEMQDESTGLTNPVMNVMHKYCSGSISFTADGSTPSFSSDTHEIHNTEATHRENSSVNENPLSPGESEGEAINPSMGGCIETNVIINVEKAKTDNNVDGEDISDGKVHPPLVDKKSVAVETITTNMNSPERITRDAYCPHPTIAIIPLNNQFETFVLELSHTYRFGRCNSSLIPEKYYYTFPSQDIGSSSGTFINGVRASAPNKPSKVFEIRECDIIQMGKDCTYPQQNQSYTNAKSAVVSSSEASLQSKCVRFGIIIIKSNVRGRIDSSTLKLIEEGKVDTVKDKEVMQLIDNETSNCLDVDVENDTQQASEEIPLESISEKKSLQEDNSCDDQGTQSCLNSHIFVIIANYFSDRVRKITLLNELGSEFADVILKEWVSNRKIAVIAKPTVNTLIYSLTIVSNDSQVRGSNELPTKFLVLVENNEHLASIEFINKMKLQVIPRNTFGDNVSCFTITGDLELGRYGVIKRFKSSRRQQYIGGSSFSKSAKNKLLEIQKMFQIRIENTPYFRTIFGAIILLHCVRFP